MAEKAFYTFLAKAQSVLSKGYYGSFTVITHKGDRFKSCCGNITDATMKNIQSKWTFIRFELRDGKFYFNRAVECDRDMSALLIAGYRDSKWKKEQEKAKHSAELLALTPDSTTST